MSECVVRMEMPSCCHDCPFEADQWDYPICRVTGRSEGYRFDARNNRMVDCPIVCSLPKGHGRLVDADDVNNHIMGYVDLRDCPTIVPAERRANDEAD